MAIVRKHIYFSGQVQGVGFRYRAKNAARANDLTGWVDNLWDGRVEMEVQGELSGRFIGKRNAEARSFGLYANVPVKEGKKRARFLC